MFFVSKKKHWQVMEELAKADRENIKLHDEIRQLKKDLDDANKLKACVYKTVVGVTSDDLVNCRADICTKYDKAHARQRSQTAAPSDFMRGITAALEEFDKLPIRELI